MSKVMKCKLIRNIGENLRNATLWYSSRYGKQRTNFNVAIKHQLHWRRLGARFGWTGTSPKNAKFGGRLTAS